MQPLISVDHESRHNSSRMEDERPHVTENTPLIQHSPPEDSYTRNSNNIPIQSSPVTTVIVSFLLIILLAGAMIGVYLLILQSNSENVLPPVEMPLQLVSRSQWDPEYTSQTPVKSSLYGSKQVIVVHTATEQCYSTNSCATLLKAMQVNATKSNEDMPYNFLVSSNGQTYGALGWQRSSSLNYIKYSPSALVLAFIGNFAEDTPSRAQMEQAKSFLAESVSQQHLDPSYSIIGKAGDVTPKYLFQSLKELPQWNSELSDV